MDRLWLLILLRPHSSLVHEYLGNVVLDVNSTKREAYAMNNYVFLDLRQSRITSIAYALYVASKRKLIFFQTCVDSCTNVDQPSPQSPVPGTGEGVKERPRAYMFAILAICLVCVGESLSYFSIYLEQLFP